MAPWSDRNRHPGTRLQLISARLNPESVRKLDRYARRLAQEAGVRVSRGRAIEMLLEGELEE